MEHNREHGTPQEEAWRDDFGDPDPPMNPSTHAIVSALAIENFALRALVRNLVQSEACDYPHRQWIYRAGPQDWDAEPMTDKEYDLIQSVVFGG